MIDHLFNRDDAEQCRALLSLMPKHGVYYDYGVSHPMLVMAKRPAIYNTFLSPHENTTRHLRETFRPNWGRNQRKNDGEFYFEIGDALHDIASRDFSSPSGTLVLLAPQIFTPDAVTASRSVYEEWYADLHRAIQNLCNGLAMVMVVSEAAAPFADMFSDWKKSLLPHRNTPYQVCWHNFDAPVLVHDDRFLALSSFSRESHNTHAHWAKKLAAMPLRERRIVASALYQLHPNFYG